jgi:hypothetical protein
MKSRLRWPNSETSSRAPARSSLRVRMKARRSGSAILLRRNRLLLSRPGRRSLFPGRSGLSRLRRRSRRPSRSRPIGQRRRSLFPGRSGPSRLRRRSRSRRPGRSCPIGQRRWSRLLRPSRFPSRSRRARCWSCPPNRSRRPGQSRRFPSQSRPIGQRRRSRLPSPSGLLSLSRLLSQSRRRPWRRFPSRSRRARRWRRLPSRSRRPGQSRPIGQQRRSRLLRRSHLPHHGCRS